MSRFVRLSATTTAVAVGVSLAIPIGAPVAAAATSPPETVIAVAGADVTAPALSGDGRYVAHHVTPRVDRTRPQLRRADLVSGSSLVLNRDLTGRVARGHYSAPPTISGNGSRVAFTSDAVGLVAGDTNGRFDAFVRLVTSRTTVLASAAADGGASNGDTGMESISRDGRYVVFTSSGTDVVPGSTTTNSDVFRRHLDTGRTEQVSVRPDGTPSRGPGSVSVAVSGGGDVVAFTSYNTDLAPADGDDGEADLFVRRMSTGTTRWLSEGLPVGADPSGVVMSPDARFVSTRWADGSLHLTRVWNGATSAVAPDAYASAGSFSASLGRFVYVANGQVVVRDLATGTDSTVPVPSGGSVTTASISGDGRYVAYDWTPDDGSPSVVRRVAL